MSYGKPVRIVCMADSHGKHYELVIPDGEILLVAGDVTPNGKTSQLDDFASWLRIQPHTLKVIIAGNHDFIFERNRQEAVNILGGGVVYLQDSELVVRPPRLKREGEDWKLTIYGSPWQPRFYDWAFNLDRNGPQLRRIWERVPSGIDILLTHGPAQGRLDLVDKHYHDRIGCEILAGELKRIRPKLHVFGHNHAPGVLDFDFLSVNAAVLDHKYEKTCDPKVVLFDPGTGEMVMGE